MNVLSLFDGMSCGQLALNRLGVKVDKYFASEIDPYAMEIARKNFPDMIHVGDVTKVRGEDLPPIDLLLGGSPCQGFSFAGKQLNFDDPRSKLFFEFVRLLNEIKPKYFLLENVNMKQEYQDVISEHLGVKPIRLNSALVSAQNRLRLYWTNIPVNSLPDDKGILLKDILEYGIENEYKEPYVKLNGNVTGCVGYVGKSPKQATRIYSIDNKSQCLTALGGGQGGKTGLYQISLCDYALSKKANDRANNNSRSRAFKPNQEKSGALLANQYKQSTDSLYAILEPGFEDDKHKYRKLTPTECERLQTVPDGYTEGVSNTQRYKMLGNGWTVDVIVHLLKNMSI
jgi:DNA (cytosine-5)-methyltransferase 3A